jgi:hypothetical protein
VVLEELWDLVVGAAFPDVPVGLAVVVCAAAVKHPAITKALARRTIPVVIFIRVANLVLP